MILSVTLEKSTFAEPPGKFEAGTPNMAGAIGLGAAIDYLSAVGMDTITLHEEALVSYAKERLLTVDGLRMIGTPKDCIGVASFYMENAHPHDIGQILDDQGIAIRAGHHCAQPVMKHFGVPATARASFGLYNTRAEVDTLIAGLHKVNEVFG